MSPTHPFHQFLPITFTFLAEKWPRSSTSSKEKEWLLILPKSLVQYNITQRILIPRGIGGRLPFLPETTAAQILTVHPPTELVQVNLIKLPSHQKCFRTIEHGPKGHWHLMTPQNFIAVLAQQYHRKPDEERYIEIYQLW